MHRTVIVSAIALAATVSPALAQDRDPLAAAMSARQSHMQLYAHNLGILGGMARGDMEYDADMAAIAAADLVALASVSQQAYWPEGSSNADYEDSRALPAIWEDSAGFEEAKAALLAAATALAATAGTGPEGLAGMRDVGGACGACHETFQESR
ncbi:c-type cytochrome [Histidinibacterium lentulum]|uniref:Cytochrome c n=1 Tax=Histidinibacterium lentulum TaxID=2480588 RepID=A0A3N2R9G8_9RHOB|nr:cytochrome c [Histidinibacterium lentulum]ROU04053.1 cytochrome c [Histidinibacterium lentulum]